MSQLYRRGEHAGVVLVLMETIVEEPREKSTLPSSSALSRSIDGLLHAVNSWLTVLAQIGYLLTFAVGDRGVPRGQGTVDDLTIFEVSL